MSSDGKKRGSFTDNMRTHADEELAKWKDDESMVDRLDLWAMLKQAANLIDAQKKELDAYAYTSPVTLVEGGEVPRTSQRIITEAGFEFVDYDGESIRVEARDKKRDVYFSVEKFGEGPVVMDWEEFAQFCRDGFDLMEKLQGGDPS